jgi:quercetin dioxygenase-like cupin family protein
MEFFSACDFTNLSNPGVVSEQLLSPHNSSSVRMTITRVTVDAAASQPRHAHDASEQVWIAMQGSGELLLANDETKTITAGQVARFEDGDLHGFENTGQEPFVYISVTAPPVNFDYAYQSKSR